MHDFYAVILVHEKTRFKSMNNPSPINPNITNIPNSFLNTPTFSRGLSHFPKLAVA